MGLEDRVAIITGSRRGIGRAVALSLARAGASIMLNDIDGPAELEATRKEIEALGRPCLAVTADVSTEQGALKLAEAATEAFDRIDILINNAGILRDQLLIRMTEEDWDTVIAHDLKSVFLCTRAVLRPMMKQRWGRIVSMASIIGRVGNRGQANYAAAKAGIIGFTLSVAKEVASRGITVNAIAPGFIETAMTDAIPEEYREAVKNRIPSGALGRPEDVAAAVAFLVSEEAAYITGVVLGVDGGMVGP